MGYGQLRSIYIALAYAAIGIAWVVGSDNLLVLLFDDPMRKAHLQTFKGIGFVAISALFILLLLLNERRRLNFIRLNLRERTRELRRLSRRLISVQENERRELAADIHGGLGQAISALRLNLQMALDRNDTKAREAAMGMIDAMVELVRTLSEGLHTTGLEENGLEGALRRHVEALHRNTGIAVELRCESLPDAIERVTQVAIFRIAQEAISNALRHAEAETVAITLRCDGNKLFLSVEDDGKGFTPAAREGSSLAARGLGLASMREYATLVGGSIRIEPRPEGGTRIAARLPLAAPSDNAA